MADEGQYISRMNWPEQPQQALEPAQSAALTIWTMGTPAVMRATIATKVIRAIFCLMDVNISNLLTGRDEGSLSVAPGSALRPTRS